MSRKHRHIIAGMLASFIIAGGLGAEGIHILESGDTLYSLSRHYGVEVAALLDANGIKDPSGLSIGMELHIPGMEAATGGTSSVSYTVHKGDTYYSIARSYSLSVNQLLTLNERDSGRVLRVGENLIVTAPATTSGGTRTEGELSSGIETRPAAWKEPGISLRTEQVSEVPWWPVAGMKAPLDGKLVGVAIEAVPQSYVHSVSSGNVVWTGPYRGFGHVVLVDSGGYIYLYGGNEDLFVNVGQSVAAGSRIGRLAASGPAGGTQEMIFSVFHEGVPVSPDEAPRG